MIFIISSDVSTSPVPVPTVPVHVTVPVPVTGVGTQVIFAIVRVDPISTHSIVVVITVPLFAGFGLVTIDEGADGADVS